MTMRSAVMTHTSGAFAHVRALREVMIVSAAYFAYFAVRGATEGDLGQALDHAMLVQRFERSMGLFIEPALQAAILGNDRLINLANWVYVFGHWPVIAAVGIWLYRTQPERYRLIRTALLISGAIGLVIFAAFPTAPPRLAEMGLIDTITERSSMYRVLQPPQLTNQYAAVPSLHVGWNLLIGIALFRGSSRLVPRLLGIASPVVMVAAVLLTANHFLVDAVAGASIALIGLALAYLLQTRAVADTAVVRAELAPPVRRIAAARGTRERRSPWRGSRAASAGEVPTRTSRGVRAHSPSAARSVSFDR